MITAKTGEKYRTVFTIMPMDIPFLKLAKVFLGRSRMMFEIISMEGPMKNMGRRMKIVSSSSLNTSWSAIK
jgi:hypothetical protein